MEEDKVMEKDKAMLAALYAAIQSKLNSKGSNFTPPKKKRKKKK